MQYGFGAIKSLDDPKDWNIGILYSNSKFSYVFPESLDLRKYVLNIRNQGSRNTSSAFVGALMKNYQEQILCDYNERFSPEFIYQHRNNKQENGISGRETMKILKNFGCCKEKLCKYRVIEDTIKLSESTYHNAIKYYVDNYARVYTINDLKRCLIDYGICYMSFPAYNRNENMWVQHNGETMIGGQAMAVVGYNQEGFILCNSWGVNYGNGGFVIFPYKDFGYHWEVWTFVDVKNLPLLHQIIETEEKQKLRCFII